VKSDVSDDDILEELEKHGVRESKHINMNIYRGGQRVPSFTFILAFNLPALIKVGYLQ
jgi:hypothetical protein